jgi:2-oxoglutarate/2-oxoacid ferredoxin oxidoreductase subunit alpha
VSTTTNATAAQAHSRHDEPAWLPKGRQLMKGNHAVCAGAIRAGCTAYFGYPITPQNEAIEYMSDALLDVPNGVFIQGESEVASVNMVMGAAASGRRVMTSSSSPGISLKQEGISYIATMELPCLVMNVVRCGPGLGNIAPHQGDYFQTVKGGGHGDYRLITLAPNSANEMAQHAALGFDLACKYRNPACILTDGIIGQMMEPVDLDAIPVVDWKKPDYAMGVRAKGDTRKPNIITSIFLDPEEMNEFHLRLMAKYDTIKQHEIRYEEYFTEDAEILCVAYGSVSRVVMGAVKELRERGVKVGLLRPITLWPFPYAKIHELGAKAKTVITFEMSWGQLVEDVALALRNVPVPVHLVMKNGGVTFTPPDVSAAVSGIAADRESRLTLWEPS